MENPLATRAEKDTKPKHIFRTLKTLYSYLAEKRGLFHCILIIILIIMGCELIMPLIIEKCIDSVITSEGKFIVRNSLAMNLTAFVVLGIVKAVFEGVQGVLASMLNVNTTARLRQDVFNKILSFKMVDYNQSTKGDLMSRVVNDTEMAARSFSDTVIGAFSTVIMIFGCGFIMFKKCPAIAFVSIGTSILTVVVAGLFSGVMKSIFVSQQAALSNLNSHIEESIKGYRTVIEADRIDYNSKKLDDLNNDYFKKRMKSFLVEKCMGPIMLVFGNLNFLLVAVVGVRFISLGIITVGALQAFILYSKQFIELISSLGESLVLAQNSLAGAERIFEIMDKPEEVIDFEGSPVISDKPAIEFSNVKFRYHKNIPLLEGVDMNISDKEKVSIVGKTGAGKTTIFNLLLRFYDNFDGDILIDGNSIRDLSLRELRSGITYIEQEPQLFEGTILENITYGTKDYSMEYVQTIVEKVGLKNYVDSLEDGLDTVIRIGNKTCSQGQLQLICIARAILRDSKIIIMDEATSSLDVDTEIMIKNAIAECIGNRTCIVIAHRLSSIIDSDNIAVLNNGVIAEYGNHSQLLEKNGIYYSLYNNQFLGREI